MTLSATRLTKIVNAVALKEIHAMRDVVGLEAGDLQCFVVRVDWVLIALALSKHA
jgi:hypothetical protein